MGYSYQLYSSRNFPPLGKTLKMLGKLGYDQVEGYGGLFAGLDDLGELRGELDAAGLTMTTGHFGLDMVQDDPARILEIAKAFDIEAVFIPAVGDSERVKDAKGWAELGQQLAEMGKPLQDAGLTFGWHNHAFEFAAIDGDDLPLDLILSGSDDMALEFDVAWAVIAGQNPLDWISKYGSRLAAAHIKDIAPKGEALDEDGWADPGHGTMDWTAIMQAIRATSCRYFVMEHDNPNDHERFAGRAIAAAKLM